jgi:PAS domain S-box-containing protein
VELSVENRTHIILNSIADGVFTVDADWKITSFNRAAEKITGVRKTEAIDRHCCDVFQASICERQCALRQTMKTGDPIVNEAISIVNAEGDSIPISISTALLKNELGAVIGGVETFRDLSAVEELRKELEDRHSFLDIISKNAEMQRLFALLEQVSESNATVLLSGESGTGKELFAKAIHSLSPRKDGPIITMNCGALPDNLLESELFGYKAGAFTDAKKDKPGRLALAEGGTLFLDEIGDISPALQVGLLRVLQDRVYEPLGGTKSVKADIRIITATNKDLEKLVSQGSFRQDLYYRINVVRLFIPPLKERAEDIPLLVNHFIRKFNILNGKNIQGLSPEVLSILMSHNFPGNVRELENILEYATVVCRNSHITVEHLPGQLLPATKGAEKIRLQKDYDGKSSWDDLERSFLMETLNENRWNRAATARQLGIHKSTLWRKMKRLNIMLPEKGELRPGDPESL